MRNRTSSAGWAGILVALALSAAGAATAAVEETWKCEVDLHQGDTGALVFSRLNGDIAGTLSIDRGAQQHRIDGSWQGEAITFYRRLSATSGQPLRGGRGVSGIDYVFR